MNVIQLQASRDALSGQVYIPPRAFVADGSLREPQTILVPAQGVLYSATSFNGETYGIVDLDCGARVQTLLVSGTDRIGARVRATADSQSDQLRFAYE